MMNRQADLHEIIRDADANKLERTTALLNLAAEAQEKFPTATPEEKRAVLETLTSMRVSCEGKLILVLKVPFDKIVSTTSVLHLGWRAWRAKEIRTSINKTRRIHCDGKQ